MSDIRTPHHARWAAEGKGQLGFAGLLFALGVFVLVDTTRIEVPAAASNVGPRFFPYAVGILLTLAAVLVIVDVLRGNMANAEDGELVDPSLPFNVVRVAGLVGSVVAFGVLLDPLGYVPACAITFAGISITLGARRYVRVGVASVVLAVLVYLAFTRALGIYLPPGVLDGIL